MSTRLKPRPRPVVYVLNEAEAALYAPAKVLILRPSGFPESPAAVLDVLDAEGAVLRRVLVNGIKVSPRNLALLIEPRGEGYHGGPPESTSTAAYHEHSIPRCLKVAD